MTVGFPLVPVRRMVTCLDGKRIPLNREERSTMQGDYPYWGAGNVVDHVDRFIFDEPLVLLGEDGAPFFEIDRDVAFAVNGRIWVNNHIHVLQPNPSIVEQRFLAYALNVTDYGASISGSTRDKLTQEDMMRIMLPLPPVDEQQQIADFLDEQVGLIDAAIRLRDRQIELLRESLVATEDALVWRGTEGAALAPVAIDPVGQAPAQWSRLRNKNVLKERRDLSQDGSEELLSVSHITGVTRRADKVVNMFLAETNEGYVKVSPGDLVINTMWAWMGALGVSRLEGIVSPAYGVYRPRDPNAFEWDYFDALYRSPAYVCEMTRFSTGVWSSRLRIYPDVFLALPVVVPPAAEQRVIAERIRAARDAVVPAIALMEKAQALLAERKRSLITAAVTGQLDPATMSDRAGKVATA